MFSYCKRYGNVEIVALLYFNLIIWRGMLSKTFKVLLESSRIWRICKSQTIVG
jgi:hypothetical protein